MYALFFREPGGRLAPHDAHAVRDVRAICTSRASRSSWRWSGYALVVWRSFWRAPALILAMTTLSLFFFYKMRIWPEHFWLARRFITAILPGALIFAAAAMFAPLWMRQRDVRGGPRTIGIARSQLASSCARSGPALSRCVAADAHAHRVCRHHPATRELAARFGDNDLVHRRSARSLGRCTRWRCRCRISGRATCSCSADPRPDKPMFREFLAWARTNTTRTCISSAAAAPILLSPGIGSSRCGNGAIPGAGVRSDRLQTSIPRAAARSRSTSRSTGSSTARMPTTRFAWTSAAPTIFMSCGLSSQGTLGGGKTDLSMDQDRSYLVGAAAQGRTAVNWFCSMSGGRPRAPPGARDRVSRRAADRHAPSPTDEFRDYAFRDSRRLAANWRNGRMACRSHSKARPGHRAMSWAAPTIARWA